MRPAFGSGEDWNFASRPWPCKVSRLRPAFGSGEDWNIAALAVRGGQMSGLRPAFGSGEDWNYINMRKKGWTCVIVAIVLGPGF
ncbi:MAG TPA: hypothetical protein VFJ72_13725 [Rubrobacteraceae bacterium]|nr:hypothetical protein [Rubrobacteraceae bacterium]